MPEPITMGAGFTAAGAVFAAGVIQGAGEEVGKRAASFVCDEVAKATEAGWQRHDEANEALSNGLNKRRTAQA